MSNDDFISAVNPRQKIPDAKYDAECIGYDSSFVLGKARKIFLNFRIIEGEHTGMKLFMAYNAPYDRKFRPGHKYYKDWVMVNGWNPPSRNATMSPRLFLNKAYVIKTRAVKPLRNKKPMPVQFHYSVVDELVEVIAGQKVFPQ